MFTRLLEGRGGSRLQPNQKVQPPGAGYGFLWRLDTCWRFEERDGGAYAECRAISLTRDIPATIY